VVLVATVMVGRAADAQTGPDPIVGSWTLTVSGAPYAPHLIQFGADGTMLISNPSDVQAAVGSDGSPGTFDSTGHGAWHPVRGKRGGYVLTFVELNAFATGALARTPTDALVVTAYVQVSGNDLTGRALAGLTPDPQVRPTATREAGFIARRISVDEVTAALIVNAPPAGGRGH
jgi:hypothetical protein